MNFLCTRRLPSLPGLPAIDVTEVTNPYKEYHSRPGIELGEMAIRSKDAIAEKKALTWAQGTIKGKLSEVREKLGDAQLVISAEGEPLGG